MVTAVEVVNRPGGYESLPQGTDKFNLRTTTALVTGANTITLPTGFGGVLTRFRLALEPLHITGIINAASFTYELKKGGITLLVVPIRGAALLDNLWVRFGAEEALSVVFTITGPDWLQYNGAMTAAFGVAQTPVVHVEYAGFRGG